mmetsp:Transcript_11983/g.22805  ORF Transcript_11983/g.22805 Transcript_11983/m.22805 type:complete len:103 (+) Transcript_11983:115-423(+)
MKYSGSGKIREKDLRRRVFTCRSKLVETLLLKDPFLSLVDIQHCDEFDSSLAAPHQHHAVGATFLRHSSIGIFRRCLDNFILSGGLYRLPPGETATRGPSSW